MGTLFEFLADLVQVYIIILFIRILLSWVMPSTAYGSGNKLSRILYMITEPAMAPFRQLIPPIGGLDLSPFVLFIVLNLLKGMFNQMASAF